MDEGYTRDIVSSLRVACNWGDLVICVYIYIYTPSSQATVILLNSAALN